MALAIFAVVGHRQRPEAGLVPEGKEHQVEREQVKSRSLAASPKLSQNARPVIADRVSEASRWLDRATSSGSMPGRTRCACRAAQRQVYAAVGIHRDTAPVRSQA